MLRGDVVSTKKIPPCVLKNDEQEHIQLVHRHQYRPAKKKEVAISASFIIVIQLMLSVT
jgi:hypothetical protein